MAPRPDNFHNGSMPVNPRKARVQEWVQKICDDLGITYTELARRAGIDSATLTRFMNKPTYKPNLSHTTVQKIAEAVMRPEPEIPSLTQPVGLPTVRVVGTAAAGLWKDVSIIADDYYTHEEIPIVENPRFAGYRQYALFVEGNSVNRAIQDGEYAICVAWGDLGLEPKDGQYVHVERNRGGLQEATIKVVRIHNKVVQLWPDSTDARFQEPIDLSHPDEDTEVVIRGLVIGKFRHFG
jgi:transcriptional regulator with XRE-family HTH domain